MCSTPCVGPALPGTGTPPVAHRPVLATAADGVGNRVGTPVGKPCCGSSARSTDGSGRTFVISVCMLGGGAGSSAAVAGYYLAPGQDCGVGYYTEHDRVPGRWVGAGAEALALSGPLSPQGAARLVELLNAQDADGQALARPVWRPDPAGRLPSGPLLTSFEQVARDRGIPLDRLLPDPSDRVTLLGLVRRSNASAVPALPSPSASTLPSAESPAQAPSVSDGPAAATRMTVGWLRGRRSGRRAARDRSRPAARRGVPRAGRRGPVHPCSRQGRGQG